MAIELTPLDGLVVLFSRWIPDRRGRFMELWRSSYSRPIGIDDAFVQDNVSWSHEGVLRGMHMQFPREQAKLISVLDGTIFDVAVDLRDGSQTRYQWFGIELSADNGRQLFIPGGFAHGFCVTKGPALVAYKCTSEYDPHQQITIHWKDPRLDIRWPVDTPIVSDKDASAPFLDEIVLPLRSR